MTAKQAIKARCRDCLAGARECGFDDCILKGLAKSKGKAERESTNRYKAIMAYCQWCLNGRNFSMCNSPDCAIYQYRKSLKNNP